MIVLLGIIATLAFGAAIVSAAVALLSVQYAIVAGVFATCGTVAIAGIAICARLEKLAQKP